MNKFFRQLFGFNKYITPVSKETISIQKELLKLDINYEHQLGIGDMVPNIQIDVVDGEPISLWDMCDEKPLILSFYRGVWCPNCIEELGVIQECLSNFSDHRIVAISPDCSSKVKQFKKEWNSTFTFAYDRQNKVAAKFGIVMKVRDPEIKSNKEIFKELFSKVGESAYQVPIPGTYVIGKHKIIKALFLDTDYTKRIKMTDLIRLSDHLQKG